MTPEERELIRARIAELEAKRAGTRKPRFAVPEAKENAPTPELGLVDTIRGGLGSFQRGQLFGFGDEIVGAGRSALEYILPETEADRIAREEFGGKEQ